MTEILININCIPQPQKCDEMLTCLLKKKKKNISRCVSLCVHVCICMCFIVLHVCSSAGFQHNCNRGLELKLKIKTDSM